MIYHYAAKGCLALTLGVVTTHALACDTPVVPKNMYAACLSDGLAHVWQEGQHGFVDEKGDVVIPLQYQFASNFYDGFASVKQNGKWGMINQV